MFFKKHCRTRISERSVLTFFDIELILKNKSYLRIGMDVKKKQICHYLFFSVKDFKHFILLVDESKNEAISILPDNYAGWVISDDSFAQTKAIALAYAEIYNTINRNYFLVDKFRRLLCSSASKTKWTEFFNSYFSFLIPLLSFDNLEIDPKSQLSSKIIYQFLNNYDSNLTTKKTETITPIHESTVQYKTHIEEALNTGSVEPIQMEHLTSDVVESSIKRYKLTIYFSTIKIEHNYICQGFDPSLINNDFLKHIINKNNTKNKKNISLHRVIYMSISLNSEIIGVFIPNRGGFIYKTIDKSVPSLSKINVHCFDHSFSVSHKRLRHLQIQHFTDYFNDIHITNFVNFLILQQLGHLVKFKHLEFIFENKYEQNVLKIA